MDILDFEIVSVPEAKAVLDGLPLSFKAPNKYLNDLRTGPKESLSPKTLGWIRTLPVEFKPFNCAQKFPRVLNTLEKLNKNSKLFQEYLDSLILDKRGDRQGFPFEVTEELTNLRLYYLKKTA